VLAAVATALAVAAVTRADGATRVGRHAHLDD
jgi:hypothetical protein